LDKDDAGRVQHLYRKAYGRAATTKEVERALLHVKEVESALEANESHAAKRRVRAWASLCRLIVTANEFIYVR
jgi:hypothetical protein